MTDMHPSSSHVQLEAESLLVQNTAKLLNIQLERNPKLYLDESRTIYMQPDFYSSEHCIVGEIFAHIGRPKKAQDNKIANDILKMLLLDKIKDKVHKKYIVVCDPEEKEKLEGKSVLAESIRQFGVEILCINIDDKTRRKLLHAQGLQKMTNAE